MVPKNCTLSCSVCFFRFFFSAGRIHEARVSEKQKKVCPTSVYILRTGPLNYILLVTHISLASFQTLYFSISFAGSQGCRATKHHSRNQRKHSKWDWTTEFLSLASIQVLYFPYERSLTHTISIWWSRVHPLTKKRSRKVSRELHLSLPSIIFRRI